MKTSLISAVLVISLSVGHGCVSKKDSSEAAKDINEAKIKDDVTANTQGASKGEQQDESTYLVDLANTGLTESELSRLAADRSANPRVKAYASDVMARHASDEKGLRELAAKKNLTLPTTLSRDSQAILADLTDEKAGADFDRKFLEQMADLNDKAISKAKGVRDNTESSTVKTYVGKRIADDEGHKAQAEKLRRSL